MREKHHTTSPPTTPLEDQKNKVITITSAALTTPEAAAYLHIQPATLEQWRWNGRGPSFIKMGRSVRYRKPDLDAFLEKRVFNSTTEAQAAV